MTLFKIKILNQKSLPSSVLASTSTELIIRKISSWLKTSQKLFHKLWILASAFADTSADMSPVKENILKTQCQILCNFYGQNLEKFENIFWSKRSTWKVPKFLNFHFSRIEGEEIYSKITQNQKWNILEILSILLNNW